jgi:thioredoxin 2
MAPDFAKAAQQCWPEVLFAKLNTETDPRTAQQYEISGIPTLMLFRHGQLVASQSGAIGSAQIAAFARAG